MRTRFLSLAICLLALCGTLRAQQADTLSIRQQNIVAIAATTACAVSYTHLTLPTKLEV